MEISTRHFDISADSTHSTLANEYVFAIRHSPAFAIASIHPVLCVHQPVRVRGQRAHPCINHHMRVESTSSFRDLIFFTHQIMLTRSIVLSLLVSAKATDAFVSTNTAVTAHSVSRPSVSMVAVNNDDDGGHGDISTDRRSFFNQAALAAGAFAGVSTMAPRPASAKIFLDPALYGDQELRQSAVNSLKESVRRAVLKNPGLAPSF